MLKVGLKVIQDKFMLDMRGECMQRETCKGGDGVWKTEQWKIKN